MELCADHFADFFKAIHGDEPFPWQDALVARLDETDEWPGVLDLPTGSGKTAALDAAVFHLALRWETPRKSALRIALVVDRRLVVDDAFTRADRIANVVANSESAASNERSVLAEVARRLQHLAGEGEPPLVSWRLRGGAPLEHDWARTPTQPTILCSTVDQVGSRLLFRGYGVSARMAPVHAGLLGNDTLILLDEAHLSEPFRQTIDAVRTTGGADIRTVVLSATPGVEPQRPQSLSANDRQHPVLKRRIEARKPTKLIVVRKPLTDAADDFASAAREIADRLRGSSVARPAVGVVVNRVALAREIFLRLQEDAAARAVLLIGRSRDIGRDQIVETLRPYRTGESRIPATAAATAGSAAVDHQLPLLGATVAAESMFVVATQCLEVGVDLDLDGLVTQAASLDALRQRFGRLNRDGRRVPAEGAILALADDIADTSDDPVYGDRLAKTWNALKKSARDDEVDFGIAAFEKQFHGCAATLAAPRLKPPILMPAYLDLWSQTWPRPAADPDVGLFLHGVERASSDISLVWRSDITEDDLTPHAEADLKRLLTLVPPRAAEMLDMPLWAVRAWLRRPDREAADRVSDAPERGKVEANSAENGPSRRVFRWAGPDDPRTGCVSSSELLPGDVLVAPADYGGCDEFGWAPTCCDPVVDGADTAARPFCGRKHAVRMARDIVVDDRLWERVSEVFAEDRAAGRALVERLLDILPAELNDDSGDAMSTHRPVRDSLEMLRRAKGRIDVHRLPSIALYNGGAVIIAAHGLHESGTSKPFGRRRLTSRAPSTEDDTASRTSSSAVSVDDHTAHVVDRVKRFAKILDLPDPTVSQLELAALLHDAGKADRRFQLLLSGADPWNVPEDGRAIAKSGRRSPPGAWERVGLPKGWRHEALSVRMALAHPRFADARDPALVLWLIGTHHGFGRPFFEFTDSNGGAEEQNLFGSCLNIARWHIAPGPGPESIAFNVDGADWTALYEDLKRRHGIWTLAHLETILRLADHRASEWEQEQAP